MIDNSKHIQVRQAMPGDEKAIASLLYDAFIGYKYLYTEEAFNATILGIDKIKERINDQAMWVALHNGAISATISLTPIRHEILYVRSLAVSPMLRRKGLGKVLMSHAESEARKMGLSHLQLTTTSFLFEAIGLYKELGFKECGFEDLYGTELIKMKKDLRAETEHGTSMKSTAASDKVDIRNCTLGDADTILNLYDAAIDLQTRKQMVVWPKFEKSFVEREIREMRQWKLMMDDRIACNWAITFQDKEIWGERDNNNAIYIHRIATDPAFRGNRFIDVIVEWAKKYAATKGKKYVRLDTLGNNTRLIQHYTSAGFEFLGIEKLTDVGNLPDHYHREPNCCRFEMKVA